VGAVVELLRSNDPVLVSFAASLLKDAKIEHAVADSNMSVIDGSINAVQTRVMVAEGEYDNARALLEDAGVALEND
jgi:putative signal transducing protein